MNNDSRIERKERERKYDVVELEANGVRRTAEAEDENFVESVSDDGVHLPLLSQRFLRVTHLPL